MHSARQAASSRAVGELVEWLRIERGNPLEDCRPFAPVMLRCIRTLDLRDRAQAECSGSSLGSPRHITAALRVAELTEEVERLFSLALTGRLDADGRVVPYRPQTTRETHGSEQEDDLEEGPTRSDR